MGWREQVVPVPAGEHTAGELRPIDELRVDAIEAPAQRTGREQTPAEVADGLLDDQQ